MSESAVLWRFAQQLMIRQMQHLTFTNAIIVPDPVQYARSLLQLQPWKLAKLPTISRTIVLAQLLFLTVHEYNITALHIFD